MSSKYIVIPMCDSWSTSRGVLLANQKIQGILLKVHTAVSRFKEVCCNEGVSENWSTHDFILGVHPHPLASLHANLTTTGIKSQL